DQHADRDQPAFAVAHCITKGPPLIERRAPPTKGKRYFFTRSPRWAQVVSISWEPRTGPSPGREIVGGASRRRPGRLQLQGHRLDQRAKVPAPGRALRRGCRASSSGGFFP